MKRSLFMRSQKAIGWIAMVTPIWFLVVYLWMSALRPEYSHLTKAISELGSWDAPNLWAWNILGYIVPGLAISLLGAGLYREFRPRARIPAASLILSGLLMALSGAFPGDFEDRSSPSMIMHLVGSLGSYVAFLVAGFGLPAAMRSSPSYRWVAWPSTALVVLSIATGFLRSGDAPGLGQRLGFGCFFMWVALMGFATVRAAQAPLGNSFKPPPLRGEA
ncbi:MAG: DUF998 domain-containing protein [Nitrospira sp.]